MVVVVQAGTGGTRGGTSTDHPTTVQVLTAAPVSDSGVGVVAAGVAGWPSVERRLRGAAGGAGGQGQVSSRVGRVRGRRGVSGALVGVAAPAVPSADGARDGASQGSRPGAEVPEVARAATESVMKW